MKDKDIEFTFNDFKDYVKELTDIKTIYDDLINNGEIQEMLKIRQENKQITEKYLGAVSDYETVMSEKKQLQNNWNELKEYIQSEYKRLHAILMTPSEYEMMGLLKVVDKMHEIERGSNSDDNN